jgi:hypothetical protein
MRRAKFEKWIAPPSSLTNPGTYGSGTAPSPARCAVSAEGGDPAEESGDEIRAAT